MRPVDQDSKRFFRGCVYRDSLNTVPPPPTPPPSAPELIEPIAEDSVEQVDAGEAAAQPWIDALRARESGARGAIGESLWRQTAALEKRGITADEAATFLDSGELPELDALAKAVQETGSWTAVESFTFLVEMRRAAISAEPSDESDELDRAMNDGLQSIYRTATYARERVALKTLARADRLEAAGDLDGATELRDRAARALADEAAYRVSLPKAKFNTADAYELAAGAQIARAKTSGDEAPLFLGDARDAGNGVAGARVLIDAAVAAQGGREDHGTLALEGARQDGRASYFAALGPAHRGEYLDARVKQADAAESRLALYGSPAKLSGADALAAASVAQERRVVLEELTAPVAESLAVDRALGEATMRQEELEAALVATDEDRVALEKDHATALETAQAARDSAQAVFGDTFKTSDEVRREQGAISDADLLAARAATRLGLAEETRTSIESMRDEVVVDRASLEERATLDREEADRVVSLIDAESSEDGYRSLRAEADEAAALGGAHLARAEQTLKSPEAELMIGMGRIDLAAFGARAVDVDALALGMRDGATQRLDRAAALLVNVDTRDPALSRAAIDAHATLAEANADYRPSVSLTHLVDAELLLDDDAASAKRIGDAAVTSFFRADARFEEIDAAGEHDPVAKDAFYAQAHRLIEGDERLARIDAALDAVPELLSTSTAQIENGLELAEAQTRSLGRSQIAITHAQMSSMITGLVWTASGWDMREDLAHSSENATDLSLSTGAEIVREQKKAQEEVSAEFARAREEESPFEMLDSLRTEGRLFFNQAPVFDNKSGLTMQSASPLADALSGPVMGYEGALERMGHPDTATITPSMQQMIGDHAAWLAKSSEGAEVRIAMNTACEVGIGIAATWGVGSWAAIAKGGASLKGMTAGAEAVSAARTLGVAARVSQAVTAFEVAHPVLYAAGVTAAVGTASLGTSKASHALFGENSGVARGLDVGLNFLPVGTGVQTAGIRGVMPAVTMGVAQTFGVTLATPELAKQLGVESETGQAVLGLALNVLIPAGVAAALHNSPRAGAVLAAETAELDRPGVDASQVINRLTSRLETEGGLDKTQAQEVGRAVERAAVERSVSARLTEAQSASDVPLTDQRLRELAIETAEKMNLDRRDAAALVEEGPFCDWVRTFCDTKQWTDEMVRDHFIRTADRNDRPFLRQLSPQQYRAIYPDGLIPMNFADLADIPGFIDFAKTDPAKARVLADAAQLPWTRALVQREAAAGGKDPIRRAATMVGAQMPTMGTNSVDPRYLTIRRGSRAPSDFPEVLLSPQPPLDHNGAYHQGALAETATGARYRVPTDRVSLTVPEARQLFDANGRPLPSMDGVLMFRGHGAPDGFEIPTSEAVKMMANEIFYQQNVAGRPIRYVLLSSCSQRDRSHWIFGKSHGQEVKSQLTAELAKRGYTGAAVDVLVSDRPGPTNGPRQRSYLPIGVEQGRLRLGYAYPEISFRPADWAVSYIPKKDAAALAITGGAVVTTGVVVGGATAGAAYLLYEEHQRRKRDIQP